MLEHERAYLSRACAEGAGFMRDGEREGILHDLGDIDRCLAELGEPLRVVLPG
jgi:hypothetical protein